MERQKQTVVQGYFIYGNSVLLVKLSSGVETWVPIGGHFIKGERINKAGIISPREFLDDRLKGYLGSGVHEYFSIDGADLVRTTRSPSPSGNIHETMTFYGKLLARPDEIADVLELFTKERLVSQPRLDHTVLENALRAFSYAGLLEEYQRLSRRRN